MKKIESNDSKAKERNLKLIFARDPGELLENVKNYLKSRELNPISMSIVREKGLNSFCAIVVGEK